MQFPTRSGPNGGRHTRLWLATLLIALVLVAPMATAQNKDWTNFGRTATHTGVATGDSLETPLQIAWSKNLGEEITASPVIDGGTVVIATAEGNVYAYDTQTSQRLWKYETGARIKGSPAIDNDHVYFATYNDTKPASITGKLYEISLDQGIKKAEVDLKSGSWAGPTIDNGGRLFIGLENGKLQHYATADITTLAWEFDTVLTDNKTDYPAAKIRTNPAVEDNVVYFSAFNRLFYAVDANSGEELWIERLIHPTPHSAPAVDGKFKQGTVDGVVYVGSYDGKLYAFETDDEDSAATCQNSRGTVHPSDHKCSDYKQWEYDAEVAIHSSPAVANGHIYIGDNAGTVHAVDQGASTNSIKADWTYDTGDAVRAAPAVVGKSIVVGSYDSKLYVFTENSEGGLADTWSITLDSKIHASPAIAEGMVFVASQGGVVYALAQADADTSAVVEGNEDAANLLIEEIKLTPRVMTAGESLTFDVIVKNDGATNSGTFALAYYRDGERVETADLSLDAGANATHQFKLIAAPDEGTFRFVVDDGNAVTESNEEDNAKEMHLIAGEETGDGGGLVIDQPDASDNSSAEDPEEDVPGPGVVATLSALIGMAFLARNNGRTGGHGGRRP